MKQSPECKIILDKLENELPKQLHYHNINHTLDVYESVSTIGKQEGVSEKNLKLLQVAAIYHDSGFLIEKENHEEHSCQLAREFLPKYNYSSEDIDAICKIIMATKMPQKPKSHLEEIICDADLAYLGRNDFFKLSKGLFKEMLEFGAIKDWKQWIRLQEEFLYQHRYFTKTAIELYKIEKLNNLQIIKSKKRTVIMAKTLNRNHLIDILYTTIGIFFCGFALKSFLVPNHFFDGGVTGVSLLLHEIYDWNIGIVIVLANIPLIVLGGFLVNKTFAIRSFSAIIGLALCLYFIPYPQITSDKLLVSIFGGAFMGLGAGLAMRGSCALDGIEVLALYTGRRISFTISEIIFGINCIIFFIAAIKLGLPVALYSILTYFVATRTINFVIEGLEEYTGVTIISGQSELIKERLVMDLSRGITVYKGERGFMKQSFDVSQPVDIVFTIVTRMELKRLKNKVYEIDPKAFIFTSVIKDASGGILKRRSTHH
jgi:uncharacterized membrane-anchored protein YitT (DUF2179 family)/predicted metal-dependent HD superfamily phosphohydrolase